MSTETGRYDFFFRCWGLVLGVRASYTWLDIVVILGAKSVCLFIPFLTANVKKCFWYVTFTPSWYIHSKDYMETWLTDILIVFSCGFVCLHVWERDKRIDKLERERERRDSTRRQGREGGEHINWWHVFKHQAHLAENTERHSVGLHVQMLGPRLFIACLIKPCTMPLSCCLSFCFSL